MKTNFLLFLVICLCSITTIQAQERREFLLEKGWRFTRDDDSTSTLTEYDDSKWQNVTVPHDWAIYGPFSPNNDMQKVAIKQDGQVKPSEHSGRTGGLPFVGTGWYRTKFSVPELEDNQNKNVTLQFDGAMSGAQVWINGAKVGEWPFGYNSFYFDVTKFLNSDGSENVLAVRLENLPESSRWYPGAGIYRNVHVIVTEDVHIPVWGTFATTPVVTDKFAKVNLKTKVKLPNGFESNKSKLVTQIKDNKGRVVSEETTTLTKYDQKEFSQEFVVESPVLWDLESPTLYSAVSKLYYGDELKDEYTTPFGIRTIDIRPNDGFYLNGNKIDFQGVCNHHDLGPLGGAVNEAAVRRQVRIMKDMGANAIRTSHNMPAPELVEACDEMGMMLMIESFDEWKIAKCQNGYNRLFDDWAEKDLVNVVQHYRNNPSVVMWCIGNEVPEQGTRHGAKVASWLQSIVNREDPTRPVTQGMDNPHAVINNNFAAVMDVAGFNYRPFMYKESYSKLPQQIILGAETASTLSSRGVYKFPVVRGSMKQYPDHQASSYDVEHCAWSNLPEDDFMQHEDLPYAIGEFVWTGFDYLGEPTPYYTNWPSHSSLFGIVDLAGIPKDRYYLYRSHWNSDKETLHILPHWTWNGHEGDTIPVFVYTNHPSAELFINGVSQGVRTKDLTVKLDGSDSKEANDSFERQKRYRLMWMDTKYEPGTVKVVAYDSEGKAVAEKEVHTAGKPYKIELTADRTTLDATGKDMSFINVRVVDKQGNLCPDDTREIKFKVRGEGSYRAAANGNPVSLELFHLPQMKLFSGQLTAIVQSGDKAGKIVFEATADGVKSAKIEIKSK